MNPCLKQKLYMNPFMKPKYTNPQSTPNMYVRLPIYTMKNTHACVLFHTTPCMWGTMKPRWYWSKKCWRIRKPCCLKQKSRRILFWKFMKPCFKEKVMECSECDFECTKICMYILRPISRNENKWRYQVLINQKCMVNRLKKMQ